MSEKRDPQDVGTYAMPVFDNAQDAYEVELLQQVAVLATGRFLGKVMTYMMPMPGMTYQEALTTLSRDIMTVIALAMVEIQPNDDRPTEFNAAFAQAAAKVEKAMTALPADKSAIIGRNMAAYPIMDATVQLTEILFSRPQKEPDGGGNPS